MADYLPLLREKLLSLPEGYEDHPWDEVVFKVGGKIYAGAGSSSLMVKTTVENQQAMILDPAITVAPYIGKHGWVMIELSDDTIEMALELGRESYRMIVEKLPKSKRPVAAE